ncbi:MAG: GntR family transcriptional regulator [Lachnospiraceae bacterium]|nr:GntR family transcriptional regulator [Lachnospiraceae bacterium]
MDFKSNVPIYLQVIADLKARMLKGEIRPGDKLPSSRELAVTYEINPNTAARIYTEMERQGLSYTRRGIGTFATEDPSVLEYHRNLELKRIIGEFISELESLGCRIEDIPGLIEEYK